MAGWIVPTLGYILLVGAAGVTAKLALRTISWQQLVLWVPLGAAGGWAVATAFCAAAGLILLFVALTRGEASTVVPATAAYPAVTFAGSALFLSESVTVARVAGTVLVIAGVVLLSR